MSGNVDGAGGSYEPPAPGSAEADSLVPGIPDSSSETSGTALGPASQTADAAWATAGTPPPSRMGRARLAFRNWRRTRPFWGGLLVILAALEIGATEWAPMKVVLHVGLQGMAGYAVPLVMALCGLLLWFSPAQRPFYSVVAVLLSLISWMTSNLGGFLLGMLLGIVGGSLAFGWAPAQAKRTKRRKASQQSATGAG